MFSRCVHRAFGQAEATVDQSVGGLVRGQAPQFRLPVIAGEIGEKDYSDGNARVQAGTGEMPPGSSKILGYRYQR
jgi:hypothetical protein